MDDYYERIHIVHDLRDKHTISIRKLAVGSTVCLDGEMFTLHDHNGTERVYLARMIMPYEDISKYRIHPGAHIPNDRPRTLYVRLLDIDSSLGRALFHDRRELEAALVTGRYSIAL